MNELTERQSQVLDFIVGFVRRRKMAPTRAEIGDGLGIQKQTVQDHLDELKKKGRLDWTPNLARSIRVLEEQ